MFHNLLADLLAHPLGLPLISSLLGGSFFCVHRMMMLRIFGLLPCIPMQVFPGDGGLRAVSTRSISICRYPLCKAPATKQGNKEEIAFSLQCERETRVREGKKGRGAGWNKTAHGGLSFCAIFPIPRRLPGFSGAKPGSPLPPVGLSLLPWFSPFAPPIPQAATPITDHQCVVLGDKG